MTPTRLLASAALMSVAAAAAVAVTAVPAGAGTARIQVLQANICGAMPNKDGCEAKGRKNHGPVPYLVGKITAGKHDVVTLNEVCESQYDELKSQVAANGWEMHGRFRHTIDHAEGCHGGRFGIAVLTSGPATDATVLDLETPEGEERRKLLCVDTSLRDRTVRACVTHLSGRRDDNGNVDLARGQARAVAAKLNRVVRDDLPVILGGDFNLRPDAAPIGDLYSHSEGRGEFREIDDQDCWTAPCRSGEATTRSNPFDKVDYVFASSRHFRDPHAVVLKSTRSDHYFLSGSVQPCF